METGTAVSTGDERRPSANMAAAAISAGTAALKNRFVGLTWAASRKPPMTGPIMAPIRPTPRAQPTPVERMAVGYTLADITLMKLWLPTEQMPTAVIDSASRAMVEP